MALEVEIEIRNTGIMASYLRIDNVTYLNDGKEINVTIGVYKDKLSRDAGKAPIDSIQIKFEDALNVELVGSNLVEMIYNKIKSLDSFKDALDV
jgi:hypothetical protein